MSVSTTLVAGVALLSSALQFACWSQSHTVTSHGAEFSSDVDAGLGSILLSGEHGYLRGSSEADRMCPPPEPCPDPFLGIDGWRLYVAFVVLDPSAPLLTILAVGVAIHGAFWYHFGAIKERVWGSTDAAVRGRRVEPRRIETATPARHSALGDVLG